MSEVNKASDLDYYISRTDGEHGRLDKQSQGIFELLGNRFVWTDLEHPKRIADIGCGTGVVVGVFRYHSTNYRFDTLIEVMKTSFLAKKFSNAQVVGIDLHQDPAMHQASNISFVQGNIENVAGIHPEVQNETFDYVFTRLLVFGLKNWPERVKQIASMLKPGGCYESQESLVNFHKDGLPDPSIEPRWIKACEQVADKVGLDWKIGANIVHYMAEAGLKVEQRIEFQWPLGTWLEKEKPETSTIGRILTEDNVAAIKRICDNMLGDSITDAELKDIKADVEATHVNSPGVYWPYFITIARKPL